MTGGGNCENQSKSNGCLFQTSKISKYFIQKFIKKTFYRNLKTFFQKSERFLTLRREAKFLNSRGSVLIEFAVCMPILIILLFYINDLVKIKRYYSQTEFVVQQIANMIQKISQKKSEKDSTKLKITQKDFWNISALAWQTIYPGKSMFSSARQHYPRSMGYYIKGLDNGKAVIKYYFYCTPSTTDGNYSDYAGCCCHAYSKIRVSNDSEVNPSQIHPSLKINPGEEKILIHTYLLVPDTTRLFWFLKPNKQNGLACFHSSVIFTPKPGLFTEEVLPPS